ncbi:MAG TPA: L-threonine 3-dehydrogenase [Armatimonadota bacterium]|jgi:threonine 3-dehydrogenase
MQLPTTMKAVTKPTAAPGVALKEVPVPKPGPDDVLVKILAASVCGTDVHIYNWDAWASGRMHPPLTIGHELAGTIVEVGANVTRVKPGDFISAESHVICGKCLQCRLGQYHACQNVKILGVDTDGCFAEYAVVPENNAWVNDASLPPYLASAQEPLGNAVYATLIEPVTAASVAIFGCGPTGLCAAAVAKAAGAGLVVAIDVNPYRLDLAERMGAYLTLNPKEDDVVDELHRRTDGNGVDVVVEMSGSPMAIQQGLKSVRMGGRFTAFGIPSVPVEIDMSQVIFNGIRLLGVSGRRMFETWYQTAALLKTERLNLAPLVTHRMAMDDFDLAMKIMKSGESGKIVLTP